MTSIKEAPRTLPEPTQEAQEAVNPPVESISNPERLRGTSEFVIGVVGESWSGSTGIAKALARRLNKPYENGNEYANRRYGLELGAIDRDITVDIRMDGWQGKVFRKAVKNIDNPVIETRVFAINLAKENDIRDIEIAEREKEIAWRKQRGKIPKRPEKQPIPALAIYVDVDKKTRVNRAYNAQLVAFEHQQQRILDGQEITEDLLSLPTKAAIERRMDERKSVDVGKWSQIHSDYIPTDKSNPFITSLKRKDGTPVYHIVVKNPDIPGVSYEEACERAVDYILQELPKFGEGAFKPLTLAEVDAIARKTETKEPSQEELPQGEVIFNSDEMGERVIREPKTNGSKSRHKTSSKSRESGSSTQARN